MPSAWISHVLAFQKANGCSYKQALQHASATYTKGSGLRNTTNPGMHTTGGNLKKSSKAQLIRLIEALGDKGIQKIKRNGFYGRK